MQVRHPAVAGRFYPDDPEELRTYIQEVLQEAAKEPKEHGLLLGGVVPHAGYIFSGRHAAHFFSLLSVQNKPDAVIILHPNHSGVGAPTCIDAHDQWRTPLGLVALEKQLGGALQLPFSSVEHRNEHAGEVMVPFIQVVYNNEVPIVPVAFAQQPGNAEQVGQRLAKVAKETGKQLLVIASSDFSHFLSPEAGRVADQWVVDEILQHHPAGVIEQVRKHQVSVCGFGPIVALMHFVNEITDGEYNSRILSQGHSGERIPAQEVVDYITIGFFTDR